jgi:flagellar M-ring protein FliF
MSTSRKVALLVVTAGVFMGFILLMVWGGQPTYRVLFSELNQEDAARVIERLKEEKVPYRLKNGGRTIEVPQEHLYETRLSLATEGIPQGGGVGFELFDRSSFGATEFINRVNLLRALQGELARTIAQFPQVMQARVHITLPEQSLFVRETEMPRATVVLKLKPGSTLQPSQLQGIVHLVSSSVRGLDPQNVHIVDTSGKVLYSMGESPEMSAISSVLELQKEIERRLEKKIEEMLQPIVGKDNVVARVYVDLDPKKVEQTEELYDPDKTAVRSEQRTMERSTGGSEMPMGVPGVASNMAAGSSGAAKGSPTISTFQRERETINYEVNRLTRRTLAPMGQIKRLTVAVLVNGVPKVVKGPDGKEVTTLVARPEGEIRQYEEMVKQVVGFDPKRGDQLRVASVPFQGPEEGEEMVPTGVSWREGLAYWTSTPLVRYGVVLLLGILLLIMVIKPLVKGFLSAMEGREIPPEEMTQRTTREATEALEGQPQIALPEDSSSVSKVLAQVADQDPSRFAAALRAFLAQER